MSKVWVVQENPRMDYSPAEQFGQVQFMTADEYRSMATSLKNREILADIERCVQRMDPLEDWVVLTGNPITMGYVFHLVLAQWGQVRCLQWDRIRGEYRPYVFGEKETSPQS